MIISNQASKNQVFKRNVIFNLKIIEEQMQILSNVLTIAVNTKINRFVNKLKQLLQASQTTLFQSSFFNTNHRNNITDKSTKNCIAEKQEFFYFAAKDSKLVINIEKHVFYSSIYVFVDRLKNVALFRDKNRLKNIISQCLKEIALI